MDKKIKTMKNLQTFEEFLNESNRPRKPINEQITIDEYIEISDGDDDWIEIAQNCIKFLKVEGTAAYWITSEDDDKKFDDIVEYWNDKAKDNNITKLIYSRSEGPDGRGSAFYGDPKIPMIKYEAEGIQTYIMPISVYNKI